MSILLINNEEKADSFTSVVHSRLDVKKKRGKKILKIKNILIPINKENGKRTISIISKKNAWLLIF